jgi:hypothetical protein
VIREIVSSADCWEIPQVRDQRTEEPILIFGEWFAIGLRRKGWAIILVAANRVGGFGV